MSFNLIFRNSKRSRKENSLFFVSLIISIVGFYMILSLSTQDVMIFLQKMESDAVNRLLQLVPAFYGMTLGVLFFLIYFASQYQMERRRKEFGVYLMLGMRRGKLFGMLLGEDLLNSAVALVIGLPVAVLLSELVSLVTAKLVGMGMIGHSFTFSGTAVALTIVGFLVIKLVAFLILSEKISHQEIRCLLSPPSKNVKKQKSAIVYGISAICGVGMLVSAYILATCGTAWQQLMIMVLTLLLGLVGTILLFYGMRSVIALLVKTGNGGNELRVFTFRQIQENVIHQSTSMAISSLLILTALCCFGAGVGIFTANDLDRSHVLDYTFESYEMDELQNTLPYLQSVLEENGLADQFSQLFEMRIGSVHTTEEHENVLQMESVMDALRNLPASEDRDVLLNNLSYSSNYPHLICLSDYNRLLEAAGNPTLELAQNEAAVYMDADYTDARKRVMLGEILSENPEVQLDKIALYLTGEIQSVDLVTDRSITLSFALILPDEQFFSFTNGRYEVYIDGILDTDAAKGASLMSTYADINSKLNEIGLSNLGIEYESYLQNMGRQLFYMVAASYITIYLAIIFLVVANTMMGVHFLMNQQKTGRRYQTLIRLGATYKTLCASAREQINWFMGLPVLVAALSSLFGVKALLAGILSSRVRGTQSEMLIVSAAMILLLCVVEYIYVTAIKRSSDHYLLTLMQPQREE
jgi:putative ABC transport system permease protein